MKKLLTIAVLAALSLQVHAQGVFLFSSKIGSVDAKVLKVDGTPVDSTYKADYVWALGNLTDASLLVNEGLPAGKSFLSTGYFSGGKQTPAGTQPNDTITIQVRAWATASGSSFASANVPGGTVGQSELITVKLGDPNNALVTPPNMDGLKGFQMYVVPVPEPGTIALGVMGVAALLFRRRK